MHTVPANMWAQFCKNLPLLSSRDSFLWRHMKYGNGSVMAPPPGTATEPSGFSPGVSGRELQRNSNDSYKLMEDSSFKMGTCGK
jgi:hypothetical protein